MQKSNIKEFNKAMGNNLPFHIIIENEINQTPFGQITVNAVIKNGIVMLKTLSLVKNRRNRYKMGKKGI